MESFVLDCLSRASKLGYTSIAFPALGTGYQKFPAGTAAHHMVAAVEKYAKQSKGIAEVRIVLYGGGGGEFKAIEKVSK